MGLLFFICVLSWLSLGSSVKYDSVRLSGSAFFCVLLEPFLRGGE